MNADGRTVDRLAASIIYLIGDLLAVWGGTRVIDNALDLGFYRDYLIPWEVRLMAMRQKPVRWPEVEDGNPAA